MEVSGVTSSGPQKSGYSLWDNDGFGFGDLLDIVNPFQHLPVISNIYRDLTGDSIGGLANVVGGTIFGGPVGGGVALANEVVKSDTGKTITEHAFNAVETSSGQASLVAEKYEKTAENTSKIKVTTRDWIYGGTFMEKA